MAPKRSVKISALDKRVKAIPGKFAGKRQKKQPLKLPNTLKISIPITTNKLDVPDTLKRVDVETKIALANEVAMSQLLNVPLEVRAEAPPKKKPGRKKKVVVSQFFNGKDGENKDKVEPGEVTKTANNKDTEKPPVKNPPQRRILTRKRVADSTIQPERVVKQRKITTLSEALTEAARLEKLQLQKDAQLKPDTTVENPIENKPIEPSDTFNAPIVATKKKRNLSLRGKQNKVEARTSSPILQTRCIRRPIVVKSCQDTTVKPQTAVSEKPQIVETPKRRTRSDNSAGVVGLRKTSTSSSSNMSWTRDISSSSATNSIIVSSNDFVRFNKKLPVIKLTNIDSEVNKYKPTSTDNKTVVSNDCTESSETESELSKVRTAQMYDNGSVNVRSLNLSSSSCNSSVTQIVNTNSNNYGKAAENLMHVLKKMDMEFINWIHETEFVSSDLNRIKDKLFNILKSEVCALTHCRKLQQISNPDAMADVLCNLGKIRIDTSNENRKINNIVEQSEDENNALVSEREDKETRKNKRTAFNKVTNNNNININNKKTVRDINEPIICNNIDNINVNPNGIMESDNNRNTIAEDTECGKTNLVNNVTSVTNKHHTTYSVTSVNKVDNSNVINGVDYNRILSNRFKTKTLGNIASLENIRIEINRTGTKRVGYKLLDTNDIQYKENISDGCKPVENDKSAYDTNVTSNGFEKENNSLQNKLDEDMVRPSTSGLSLNKFTHYSSSESSDSDSSSDRERFRYDKRANANDSPHEDDDALSLFAESLTGMETSRGNTSAINNPPSKNEFEEYIPKPIQTAVGPPNKFTYCPTKISEQVKNGVVKTVCEKQNADSTSIYKDKEAVTPLCQDSGSSPNINDTSKPNLEENSPQSDSRPRLMDYYVQTKPGDFNTILKGYCILNLMHRCPLVQYSHLCRFSHDVPSEQQIKMKLVRMDKKLFTKEYMLIRRRPIMLLRFGSSFLYECAKRNYTRMLVEMAFDFIKRIESGDPIRDSLKLTAVELALLHLNNVDLSVCEDLLLLEVNEESLLCDVFMQTMTCTQNFSRFKPVFLSLTYFLVNNDRTFTLEITEQILERLCILPFDEPVIKAFIQIMRLTSPQIFLNSRIEKFEKIISVNSDVSGEYWALKKEVNLEGSGKRVDEPPSDSVNQTLTSPALGQPDLITPVEQPFMEPPDMQPLKVQTHTEQALSNRQAGVPLPPSPDTTHLDNMIKTAEDNSLPKITRTIWGLHPNANTRSNITPSSSNSNETTPSPNYKNWIHRNIFQKINRTYFSPRLPMRPPARFMRPPHRPLMRKPPFGERRLVTYGGSPVMYPPPGSNY